jgi:outer membrane protein, heavy metal efflux system
MFSANRRFRRVRKLALLFCSALVWNLSEAADISLREAVALTLERNPQLAAFAHESEASRQHSITRAASPPIILQADFENFAGTGTLSGTDALEATLQISKVFELGGKPQHRVELGEQELAGVEARQRAVRADVVAEAARRFLHLLSDQLNLEVTRLAARLAEQARDVVQARIREGAISTMFLNRAEIELARARIDQEHAEHELAAARIALSVMWDDRNPSFARASGDLFAFANVEAVETYLARLDENPGLLAFATQERVAAAKQRLAESRRSPDLTISAGVRRLEAFEENALVAGFSLPIGMRSRAESELRAARAESEQLRLDATARRLELHSLLFSRYQELLHARTEANALHFEITPQALKMVEAASDGYRQGRYSLVELIDAQKTLAEIERDSIRAALEFHSNLIEIERATGVAVHTFADR